MATLHPHKETCYDADEFAVVSSDPSILTRVNFNSARVGQVVGFNWMIGTNPYQSRYTVRSGDTVNIVAQRINEALWADEILHAYLEQIGMMLTASAEANFVEFDAPTGMIPVAFGPDVTVTTHGLDNNPVFKLCRYIPGYQFDAPSELGKFTWEMNSGPNTGIDMTAAAFTMFVTGVVNGVPSTKLSIGTVCKNSPKNALQAMYFCTDNGCRTSDIDGNGNDVITPPGPGNFGTHALYLRPHNPRIPLRDGLLWVDENGNLKFRKNGQTRTLA